MKGFILGVSLVGNAIFGYHLIKENGILDDLNKQADGLSDKIEGKAKQVSGTVTDNNVDKIEGQIQENTGKSRETVQDLKEKIFD
ncbi:CsbD family protein [Leuconostoc citreum]